MIDPGMSKRISSPVFILELVFIIIIKVEFIIIIIKISTQAFKNEFFSLSEEKENLNVKEREALQQFYTKVEYFQKLVLPLKSYG